MAVTMTYTSLVADIQSYLERTDQATIDKVAKDFKVFAQKVPGKDGKSYTIDHTAGSYVFDAQGRIRLFVRHGQPDDALLKDLRQLLAGA